jgi:4-amino-4-deoxy-L-arabinose transferase-like glycosyltransferase
VFLTGILTKEIGGGKYAQVVAACSMAASPMFIAFGGFYSMNAFEPLLALLLLYHTIEMIKENNVRKWIPIGIIMGLGMMNKHTFALFIASLFFSLILAGQWKLLLNKWFILGGLCGAVLFIPNILWQMANNYPSLEFYKNISAMKNIYTQPIAFVLGQVTGMSPFNVPFWIAGTMFLLSLRESVSFDSCLSSFSACLYF